MLRVKRALGSAMLLGMLCLSMLAMPVKAGPRLRVKVTGTTVGPGFVRKEGKSKSSYVVTRSDGPSAISYNTTNKSEKLYVFSGF